LSGAFLPAGLPRPPSSLVQISTFFLREPEISIPTPGTLLSACDGGLPYRTLLLSLFFLKRRLRRVFLGELNDWLSPCACGVRTLHFVPSLPIFSSPPLPKFFFFSSPLLLTDCQGGPNSDVSTRNSLPQSDDVKQVLSPKPSFRSTSFLFAPRGGTCSRRNFFPFFFPLRPGDSFQPPCPRVLIIPCKGEARIIGACGSFTSSFHLCL